MFQIVFLVSTECVPINMFIIFSVVTYEGAVNVLAYASSNYKHHETIDFLDQFLLKIVNILGAQK